MSGPKTAIVTYPETAIISGVAVGGVVIAALALREAYRIGQETQQAKDAAATRDVERELSEQRLLEAQTARRIGLQQEAESLTGTLLQQCEAVSALLPDLVAALPAMPLLLGESGEGGNDSANWQAYVASCQQALKQVSVLLAEASALAMATANAADVANRASSVELPRLDVTLQTYLLERQRNPSLSGAETRSFTESAAQILERLDRHLMPVVPPAIATLAREIILAPNRTRADALASELRLQVQQANAQARAEKAQAEHQAAAFVLEASLRDLGYTVDGITDTVFVEGGVVHFQKRGWGDYFVRLRLDAGKHTANFNVVRGAAAGHQAGDMPNDASAQRSDQLAEDRWCAEMPRLFQTLRERGVNLELVRHIAAGQLPVQMVDPASLPKRAREEERHSVQSIARERPLS